MGRIRVHHKVRSLGRSRSTRQRSLHRVHRVQANAGIRAAIQAQHGRVQLFCHVHRVQGRELGALTYQPPVPGHTRFNQWLVRGVQPSDAPAPAKAGDCQALGIASVAPCPGHGGIQIGHHLGIGYFGNHLGHQFAHVGIARCVALARHQIRGYSHVAQVRKTARHVGNMLVQAEDLGHHQHDRRVGDALGDGAVSGHREAVYFNLHLAGLQTLGRGLHQRLAGHGHYGGGKTYSGGGRDGCSTGGMAVVLFGV